MKYVLSMCAMVICLVSVASVSAGQGSGGLTGEDYVEIQQLYARYAHTLDLGDAEGWAGYVYTRRGIRGFEGPR